MTHVLRLSDEQCALFVQVLGYAMDEATALMERDAVTETEFFHTCASYVSLSELWEAVMLSVNPPEDEASRAAYRSMRERREAIRALASGEGERN